MDYLKFYDQFKIYEGFNLSDLLIGDSTWYPIINDDWRRIMYSGDIDKCVEAITEVEFKFIKTEVSKICDRFGMIITSELVDKKYHTMIKYTSSNEWVYCIGIGKDDETICQIVFHKFKDEYWLIEQRTLIPEYKRDKSLFGKYTWNRWICDGLNGIRDICGKDGGISEVMVECDNISESYSPNKYWSVIDQGEWNDLLIDDDHVHTLVPFIHKEIDDIRELSCELDPEAVEYHAPELYPHGWSSPHSYIHSRDGHWASLSVSFYIHTSYIIIYKLPDEWFVITESWGQGEETFYKCDQFDGLIEAIKYLYERP